MKTIIISKKSRFENVLLWVCSTDTSFMLRVRKMCKHIENDWSKLKVIDALNYITSKWNKIKTVSSFTWNFTSVLYIDKQT